jgi:hypothetical protein
MHRKRQWMWKNSVVVAGANGGMLLVRKTHPAMFCLKPQTRINPQ